MGYKTLFLFLGVLLVCIALCADTIILKNGKKVQGTIIGEDTEAYQVRDSNGIVVTIKKSLVDDQATRQIQEKEKKEKTPEAPLPVPPQPTQKKEQQVSVAELARQMKEKKTNTARVLRKEDLDKTPEVSVIGTEDSGEEPKEPAQSDKTSEKTEEYWKQETRKFAVAIRKVQGDVELYEKECEDLGKQAAYAISDPSNYVIVNGVPIPISGSGYDPSVIQRAQKVCFDAEKAKKELSRLQIELENFQEYARREGALPGWIDPERL